MTPHLWIPLRSPEDTGIRARASQLLEMLLYYGLVEEARLEGEGFRVVDGRPRHLTAEQVRDEYGDRFCDMVQRTMDHSELTTTEVSVPVSSPGPVPYIEDPGDRYAEYNRFWALRI